MNPRVIEPFNPSIMILGAGIDIVNIERIDHLITRWGDLFLRRVFTEKEIDRCQRQARPSECFAIRFAAKEAFLKAVGLGYREGIRWIDMEVANDSMGKPFLFLHGKAMELVQTLGVHQALLTLSHDRPFAVAHVLLEGKNDESRDC
jgi:holo-[acyl-carrier protein] synthase